MKKLAETDEEFEARVLGALDKPDLELEERTKRLAKEDRIDAKLRRIEWGLPCYGPISCVESKKNILSKSRRTLVRNNGGPSLARFARTIADSTSLAFFRFTSSAESFAELREDIDHLTKSSRGAAVFIRRAFSRMKTITERHLDDDEDLETWMSENYEWMNDIVRGLCDWSVTIVHDGPLDFSVFDPHTQSSTFENDTRIEEAENLMGYETQRALHVSTRGSFSKHQPECFDRIGRCESCNGEIIPTILPTAKKKYCSNACRQRAYNERKRAIKRTKRDQDA